MKSENMAIESKTQEQLTADLEAMAKLSLEAEETLAKLAAGMFPGGGSLQQLTWSEERPKVMGQADDLSMEEKLRAAEARFRTLVEQIPAVTFMAVLGEGKNEVYVSPHIEHMLGFTQREWLDNPFLWYWQLHPDDRPIWNAEFARGVQTGGPFRAECRFMARDGHPVWVHGEARLVKDDLGRPQFLQGVAFDITETKRAQEVLLKEAVSKARIAEELAIAQRVQSSILPRSPKLENLTIASAMIPAEDVGGDYYDVLPFAGGGWIGIGDVSGHGLNAGLVMLLLQSAMSTLARVQPSAVPSHMLAVLNDVIYDCVRHRLGRTDHITFTLLRYSANGQVLFSGAHDFILVCRAETGEVERIATPGTWLAALANVRDANQDSILVLKNGDIMVLYTDGIIEAANAKRELFDIDRLCATIKQVRQADPAAIRDHILNTVHGWMHKQEDDMTLLVMRYTCN